MFKQRIEVTSPQCIRETVDSDRGGSSGKGLLGYLGPGQNSQREESRCGKGVERSSVLLWGMGGLPLSVIHSFISPSVFLFLGITC